MGSSEIKSYTFNELTEGLTAEFKVSITEESIRKFAELSGDVNPLHTDSEFAKSAGFDTLVAHGALVSSFLSRLVGHYLPGKNALFLSQNVDWPSPTFPGDELVVHGEIVTLSAAVSLCQIKATMTNQKNQVVCRAKLNVKVLK